MDQLDEIVRDAPARIVAASGLADLETIEAELIGKRSVLAEMQRGLGTLGPEARPAAGKRLHEARLVMSALIEERRVVLEMAAADRLLAADAVDVSLRRMELPWGSAHLIQQTIDEVCEIFVGLGYDVADGPEAELGWYNFDALNTPSTHPARAESDTLYLDYPAPEGDEVLLRTQTSPMQARWMEERRPPVAVVVPGKVYRADAIDASHLPVFHQIEGLAVDEGIVFSDLKGILGHFARAFFGDKTRVRFRPHFFPFTEPSAELDVSCFVCEGESGGCRVCGGAGWLEMLGCGMVDPNVFLAVGYDPQAVTGFAFGMGVERLAMVRHGINDIRHFIENDVRFLSQFP